MRQRVAVARAILRQPDLLLLDKPYAGLDTESPETVNELVRATRALGGTVVLATHEPSREGLADRTLFMQDSHLLPEGSGNATASDGPPPSQEKISGSRSGADTRSGPSSRSRRRS